MSKKLNFISMKEEIILVRDFASLFINIMGFCSL